MLMVVVVVAVGGVFARLFVYHGEPRLPSVLWKSMWKDLPEDNDLNTTLDGPAMWKNRAIWYGSAMWKMERQWAKRKEDGATLFCLSFMTCTRLDYVYV